MRNPHGEFVWYELMTTDAAAAKAFYISAIDPQGALFSLIGVK